MKKVIHSFDPATGNKIGSFKINSVNDLKLIIKEARIAQKFWEKVPIEERVKFVLKIKDYIIENADKISEIIAADNGKTRIDALATEVLASAMAVNYYCKRVKKFLRTKKLKSGNIFLINKRSKIIRIPYGVVGIISPWNYPFSIPFSDVIIGLLSGNAVVLKTASETQMVGKVLEESIISAGLPKGIFNYINLPGKIAGDAFIECEIDKIFFTGSVEVGKYLMSKASAKLTPLRLELGGNDAMIVCEDADPYRSAMGALWAGFHNSGQSCAGVERIYVHENIYDVFMSILKEKIENLRVNTFLDYNTDMGCMTTKSQIETVNQHVKDALSKGAIIFAKSQTPSDKKLKNFLPAIVLTNVNHEMLVMRNETFGPVVGVMKFKDYADAIRLANDSNLGLTGSVWTMNKKRGEEIAIQIKAGVITINDHLMSHGLAETPWGGLKESGIGRTHGQFGFEEMTQSLTIINDILPFVKKNLWWHPYSEKLYSGIKGLMDLLYNKKISKRFNGFIKLLKIVPRIFKEE